MANEPAEVQRTILARLRNEQEKELRLINNLLGEITRIMLQKHDRAPEIERLRAMPQDHPAIIVGLETLIRNDETNLQLHVALKMVREQVLQVREEKSDLINNYQSI
jgi:hypothetical protein